MKWLHAFWAVLPAIATVAALPLLLTQASPWPCEGVPLPQPASPRRARPGMFMCMCMCTVLACARAWHVHVRGMAELARRSVCVAFAWRGELAARLRLQQLKLSRPRLRLRRHDPIIYSHRGRICGGTRNHLYCQGPPIVRVYRALTREHHHRPQLRRGMAERIAILIHSRQHHLAIRLQLRRGILERSAIPPHGL